MQVDILQVGATLVVDIALPGVLESDIDVALSERHLKIRAERAISTGVYVRAEMEHGFLTREVELPFGVELARASFEDGVLRLYLNRV